MRTQKEIIISVLKNHEQEMEGYSYYGSNPGVPRDDYEEIADEIISEMKENESFSPTVLVNKKLLDQLYETKAKVQGLVSKVRGMLIEREAVGYTLNHDERNGARIAVEMLSGAVKLLTSGQPANGVMVPYKDLSELLNYVASILEYDEKKLHGTMPWETLVYNLNRAFKAVQNGAIKGIGKGGA